MPSFILTLLCWSSGTEDDLFAAVLSPSKAGQRFLQFQPSILAQKKVEKRIQKCVEAGQTVAYAIDEENGSFKSTWLISQQQGHKSVTAHQVIRPEHDDKVDGDHNQDAHDFVPLMVREGWRSLQCHTNVG